MKTFNSEDKIVSTTPVYLSEEEALLFVKFQKHHAFIMLMDSLGAFDIKSGKITIHFDNLGRIAGIDKQEHYRLYS